MHDLQSLQTTDPRLLHDKLGAAVASKMVSFPPCSTASTAIAEKTIIGFAVGNLLSLTAQGVIGHSNNTRLVKQKPPWAPASVWASLQDHQDEQGALIDFRQSKVSPN